MTLPQLQPGDRVRLIGYQDYGIVERARLIDDVVTVTWDDGRVTYLYRSSLEGPTEITP